MTAREAMLLRLRTLARSRAAEAPEGDGSDSGDGSGSSEGADNWEGDEGHEGTEGSDGVEEGRDGTEALLDLVFEWFRACFSAGRARGGAGVFHYEINTPLGVRHRYVSVEAGTCTTSASLERTPNATIGLALHDLVALAVGELKGTDAFVSGRLKISGDVFFAMNWIEWFGARSAAPPGTGDDTA
ncbi:SCP2 sterol-binding domain-containing protein [Streptomyces sp. NBC_01795]|uniref:SCP2 sterol-binding domain-containing protein n=1 Tax=Streptomyces sp. NBC_01795 TaxID=2975943 RepID=UPI002DD8F383|nr:SCP2 sterol-binding domain-containing protein [Streptomyces sp. NBC_01795]WSA95537.1 SCP2 sterol-binding domain-containing protein [Streptomyces sp. NBC_01795]